MLNKNNVLNSRTLFLCGWILFGFLLGFQCGKSHLEDLADGFNAGLERFGTVLAVIPEVTLDVEAWDVQRLFDHLCLELLLRADPTVKVEQTEKHTIGIVGLELFDVAVALILHVRAHRIAGPCLCRGVPRIVRPRGRLRLAGGLSERAGELNHKAVLAEHLPQPWDAVWQVADSHLGRALGHDALAGLDCGA